MSLVIQPLLTFCNVTSIGFGALMKLPQVYALIKSKSSVGLSMNSLLLELTGYCIVMSYNIYSEYPLMSYLEYPFLVIQDILLLMLSLVFSHRMSTNIGLPAIAFTIFMYCIAWGIFPISFILLLVALCTPLSASSKILQLKSIISNKDSTGVSMMTWILSAYTSLARFFTTYIETSDISMLINFGVSYILAASIIVSIKIYEPKVKKKD